MRIWILLLVIEPTYRQVGYITHVHIATFMVSALYGLYAMVAIPDSELPDGWTTDRAGRLRCPHGHICDPDGGAQDGCESPLLDMGLI